MPLTVEVKDDEVVSVTDVTGVSVSTDDPNYQYFYGMNAVSLMPRWGGYPGDWERFAEWKRVEREDGSRSV